MWLEGGLARKGSPNTYMAFNPVCLCGNQRREPGQQDIFISLQHHHLYIFPCAFYQAYLYPLHDETILSDTTTSRILAQPGGRLLLFSRLFFRGALLDLVGL